MILVLHRDSYYMIKIWIGLPIPGHVQANPFRRTNITQLLLKPFQGSNPHVFPFRDVPFQTNPYYTNVILDRNPWVKTGASGVPPILKRQGLAFGIFALR